MLDAADGSVKTAIVMARRGVSREEAERLLVEHAGQLRTVVGDPPPVRGAMTERPALWRWVSCPAPRWTAWMPRSVRLDGPTHATLLVHFVTRPYNDEERLQLRSALHASATARTPPRSSPGCTHGSANGPPTRWRRLLAEAHVPASDLTVIAFPGQTIWHEPPAVSWQLGEPAVLAERFGVRVVSGFRARDVAAGGQGAPLVPMADVLLFAATAVPRVLLNLGGMANLTFVPRRAQEDGVLAFDTGPGVAIIDAVARMVDRRGAYDRDGRIAARGKPDEGGARRAACRPVLCRGAPQEYRPRAVRR